MTQSSILAAGKVSALRLVRESFQPSQTQPWPFPEAKPQLGGGSKPERPNISDPNNYAEFSTKITSDNVQLGYALRDKEPRKAQLLILNMMTNLARLNEYVKRKLEPPEAA